MARYSIDETTLTALGDAIRGKTGATEYRDVTYTSKPYHLDVDIHDSSNYLYIPVMGATTIKITKLATTTTELSNTLYLSGCSAIDIGRWVQVGVDEFTLYNFTADTFGMYSISSGWTYDFTATWYDADGNVMEVVINDEVPKTMTPERMAAEINNMPAALTANDLALTGACNYRFAYGGWDWVIEKYGDMITANKITNTTYMFHKCLVDIPFEINCDTAYQIYMAQMFYQYYGHTMPMIHTAKPSNLTSFMSEANNVRALPEGFAEDWNWSAISSSGQYNGPKQEMFGRCYSLRKLPMELLKYGNSDINVTYNQFYGMCKYCASLDEIVDLPNPHIQSVWNNSSAYNQAFKDMLVGCYRLKNFTFAEMEPVNWALQTLDLSQAGYGSSDNEIILYNSGITKDKKVSDDATYQALKNDPDWYTLDVNYSRYNHDSAVATINSLPDCSAYQTESGKGANILALKQAAGTSTDGGAIGNLTEDEIAVAAAKGWTVSLKM